MIEYLRTFGTRIRVVVNAVSLETVSELTRLAGEFEDFELVQVAVSRSRCLGSHHLMMAENPVYIASFTIQPGIE